MKVLVVDDDTLALSALTGFIGRDQELELVGTATDGTSAIKSARTLRPHVVVMDLHLGSKISGIEAIRTICHSVAPPKVLALTAFDNDSYLRGAFEAGALGFLLKTDAHDFLTRTIKDVYAGHATASPWATERLIENYVVPKENPVVTEAQRRVENLTDRERQVATLIGEGNTYEEIAHKLFISPSTVKATISSAMRKTDTQIGAQLAVLVERASSAPTL